MLFLQKEFVRLIQSSGVLVVLSQAWIEELYHQVLERNLLAEAGYWGSPDDHTLPLITMLTGTQPTIICTSISANFAPGGSGNTWENLCVFFKMAPNYRQLLRTNIIRCQCWSTDSGWLRTQLTTWPLSSCHSFPSVLHFSPLRYWRTGQQCDWRAADQEGVQQITNQLRQGWQWHCDGRSVAHYPKTDPKHKKYDGWINGCNGSPIQWSIHSFCITIIVFFLHNM